MTKGKKQSEDKFKFKKQLRIIRDTSMISAVFDEPVKLPEKIPRSFIYEGTVLGIPTRLFYDESSRYWIETQEQNNIDRIYNEAINRLLANKRQEERSLSEILSGS